MQKVKLIGVKKKKKEEKKGADNCRKVF